MGESIGKNEGVNDKISDHDDNDINYDNNDLSDDDNDFSDDDNDFKDDNNDFNNDNNVFNNDFSDDNNGYVDDSLAISQTTSRIGKNKKDTRSLKKAPKSFIKDKRVSSTEVFTISKAKFNQVQNKKTKDLTKKGNLHFFVMQQELCCWK